MALSDLISKPVVAPLEGFDKSVQTGFELAQNQEKLRIAQENVNLQQQQISEGFMSKAIGMLPAYLKATGKSKKMIGNAFASLWQRSGNAMNPEVLELINADDEISGSLSQEYDRLKQLYGGDPIMISNALRDKFGADSTDFIERMMFEKQQMASRRALMQEQQAFIGGRYAVGMGQRVTKATDEVVKSISSKTPSNFDKLAPNLSFVRGVLNKPKVTMADIRALKPQIAKVIGGAVGNLTENEQADAIPPGLEDDIKKIIAYAVPEGRDDVAAPADLVNVLRERVNKYSDSIVSNVTQKMLDEALSAQRSPTTYDGFVVGANPDGSVSIGYGTSQVIDRINSILKTSNTVYRNPKTNKIEAFDLQGFIANQKVPPTNEEISNFLRRAVAERRHIILPAMTAPPSASFRSYIQQYSPTGGR